MSTKSGEDSIVANAAAFHITITGIVQGVGFRPFVYNLARRLDLHGWVLNHSGGVDIEAEGSPDVLDAFIAALEDEAPPLAHITALEATPIPPNGYPDFEIRHSEEKAGQSLLISPDVATCDDCLGELFDPTDRRYRYPFINCTNCGPRFTIIEDIPYDRPKTTMRDFPLCDACRAEYEDPADRRFHAQPNACPDCGPHVWLVERSKTTVETEHAPRNPSTPLRSRDEALIRTRDLLLDGKIVALKGLGGFHLACDATNADAVRTLRERKRRPHKPFAVMLPTLDAVRAYCDLPPAAEELLTSPQCPIVLLDRRPTPDLLPPIADNVAPHQRTLGVMIPYTPLHHILLRDVDRPLVMTSGNLTEEPIAKDNDEALRRLAPLADAFLLHNRDIYARYDDSVVQVIEIRRHESGSTSQEASSIEHPASDSHVQPIRRARGYAPFPVPLPFSTRPTLAVGPLLKNTFCLTRDTNAFLSQHIGDLEDLETLQHYEAALATYKHLFRLEPERVVSDLHPDYLSTRFARAYAADHDLPAPLQVQHHHAHIAACLADNGRAPDAGPVIGVALDGTGYGADGAIWGGEWLIADYADFRRAAHLEYLPLPGGDAATRHPWRIAVAYVTALLGAEALPAGEFCPAETGLIRQMVERNVNVPQTSSMGRLFDAVSALLDVRRDATYEAQAAMELEQLAASHRAPAAPYPFALADHEGVIQIRVAALFETLLDDVARGTPVPHIAKRFHDTVAEMILRVSTRLREETDISTVALSGGVFQNHLLLELTVPRLRAADFDVLLHRQVPPNDGGLSLGQAAIANVKHET
ncbi:MAG: carbamoyltransferase HypF [Anaerolineae bacterium]